MTTVAPLNSAPMTEMCSNPRIVPPQTAENLAGSFLPRAFTVSRAAQAVRCPVGQQKGTVAPAAAPPSLELLVVLSVEEARDIDRVTPVIGIAFFGRHLGCAARDVRHALEQCTAAGGRLRFVLILRWSDWRSPHRRCQDVVAVEQELIRF